MAFQYPRLGPFKRAINQEDRLKTQGDMAISRIFRYFSKSRGRGVKRGKLKFCIQCYNSTVKRLILRFYDKINDKKFLDFFKFVPPPMVRYRDQWFLGSKSRPHAWIRDVNITVVSPRRELSNEPSTIKIG